MSPDLTDNIVFFFLLVVTVVGVSLQLPATADGFSSTQAAYC